MPKYLQLLILSLYTFALNLRTRRVKRSYGLFIVLQWCGVIIYTISVALNIIIGMHTLTRILATLNTLLVTVLALLLYNSFSDLELDKVKIGKYSFINMIILFIVYFIYLIINQNITFLGHSLYGSDWLDGGYSDRFYGFLDYSNMVVFFIFINLPLSLPFLEYRASKIKNLLARFCLYVAYAILSVLVVRATHSRVGIVCVTVLLICYALRLSNMFSMYRRYKAILLIILLAIVVGLFVSGWIGDTIDSLLNSRLGSNSMRSYIYLSSIERMLSVNPILGCGIKDNITVDFYYGSHSTYIGYLYKAGFLGGVFFIGAYVYLFVKVLFSIKRRNSFNDFLSAICILLILLMMILEDIDGCNWSIALFFAFVALGRRKNRVFCNNWIQNGDFIKSGTIYYETT